MQEVVAKLNVAAFAVDDQLRVVAWNEHAEGGGRIPASEALGRLCFEVLPAVDVETGRPCQETCPLLPESARQGWAHNRALRAPWKGGGWVRLQCFAVKAALPNEERRSICLLEPPEDHALERQARVLDLIEALYPALAAQNSPAQAIAASLEALRTITGADGAELFLQAAGGGFESAVEVGRASRSVAAHISDAAAAGVPGVPGGPPHLVIAEYPHDQDSGGPTGWTLCAPIVAQGRMAGLVAISSGQATFEVAAAARVMFPLSVHLASYVAALNSAQTPAGRPAGAARLTAPLAPRLVVRCLGPLMVSVDGQVVPGSRFKRQKALQTLAYLVAHRGRPVSREALIEVLWPGADPRQAGRNLRVILHDLRRGLDPDRQQGAVDPSAGDPSAGDPSAGDPSADVPPADAPDGAARVRSSFVRNEGDLIVLDSSDHVWVDAEAFVEASRRAALLGRRGEDESALAACREAMALYQGDFLEDDLYADWAIICREQFRELFLGIIKQAMWLLDRCGNRDEAIGLCRRALQVDRSREEFHRDLMRLFVASGRRDEAVRQYQACRRILRRDLNTVPAPETEALFRSLSEAAPA